MLLPQPRLRSTLTAASVSHIALLRQCLIISLPYTVIPSRGFGDPTNMDSPIQWRGIRIQQAMQAGAKGYLIKNALPQEMIKAIHTVAQGGYHFQHQVVPLCSPPPTIGNTEAIAQLTPKEKEVFRLILEGHRIPTIAKMLNREVRTIRMHRENIHHKLGVESDTQLILWATQAGI